ncbi:MAG: NYN domain-containing protein [bacterium]
MDRMILRRRKQRKISFLSLASPPVKRRAVWFMGYQQEKLQQAVKGRIMVAIDAANLEQSVKSMKVKAEDVPLALFHCQPEELCWRVDYGNLVKFFTESLSDVAIHYYTPAFGHESHERFLVYLRKELGIIIHTKSVKEIVGQESSHLKRKANFDVELAVDTVLNIDNYDVLILFSGDSDFVYLVNILKGKNRRVIVFSRTGHVARELLAAANYYYNVADFRRELLRVAKSTRSRP